MASEFWDLRSSFGGRGRMSPPSARLDWRRSDTEGGRNGTAAGRLRQDEGDIRNDVDERTDL